MVANVLTDYSLEDSNIYTFKFIYQEYRAKPQLLFPQQGFEFRLIHTVRLKIPGHIGFGHGQNVIGGVGTHQMIDHLILHR